MKRTIFLSLIIALTIASCAQEDKSQLQGAWQLVSLKTIAADTVFQSVPGNISGGHIIICSKEHFVFIGRYTQISNSQSSNVYGGGTYKLDGNRLEEYNQYHVYESAVGQTIRFLIEIRNDTLTSTYPANKDWKIDKSNYAIEKFIRLK